jgi:hypothetical protein
MYVCMYVCMYVHMYIDSTYVQYYMYHCITLSILVCPGLLEYFTHINYFFNKDWGIYKVL